MHFKIEVYTWVIINNNNYKSEANRSCMSPYFLTCSLAANKMTNNYTDWIRLDFFFFACPVSCTTFVSVSRILVISIWGELWPSLTFDLCPWPPSLCHMMDLCVTHATVLLSPSSSLPLLTPPSLYLLPLQHRDRPALPRVVWQRQVLFNLWR